MAQTLTAFSILLEYQLESYFSWPVCHIILEFAFQFQQWPPSPRCFSKITLYFFSALLLNPAKDIFLLSQRHCTKGWHLEKTLEGESMRPLV